MKPCSHCKVVKLLTEYGPDKSAKDGRQSWCRDCRARAARERYLADPEKVRAIARRSARARYRADPEKFNARSRANRNADPEKYNAAAVRSRHKLKTANYASRMVEKARARNRLEKIPPENWLPLSVIPHVAWELYPGPYADLFVFSRSDRWNAPSLSRLIAGAGYNWNCVVEPMGVNGRRLDDGTFHKLDLTTSGHRVGLLVPFLDRLEYAPFQSKPFTADMAEWVEDHARHLWEKADGIGQPQVPDRAASSQASEHRGQT